jgi:hypothetical protein
MAKIPKRIYWKSNLWQRSFILNDIEGNAIGGLKFKIFSADADAHIFDYHYSFVLKGFLRQYIDIYNDQGVLQGTVTLKPNSKFAQLKLINGKLFKLNKVGWTGKEWSLIRDYEDSVYDPVVLSFKQTKSFFESEGRINNEEILTENEPLVMLAGFYISLYLKKRGGQAGAS